MAGGCSETVMKHAQLQRASWRLQRQLSQKVLALQGRGASLNPHTKPLYSTGEEGTKGFLGLTGQPA